MIYASEDLVTEHEGILFGLKILEKMTDLIKADTSPETNDLREMIDFFKLFADKCHHGKEEGILFPEMEKAGIRKDGGLMGQILTEHVEGRKYVTQMSEALRNEFQADDFISAAVNYINLLRNHIEKENEILFPLGDSKIPMNNQAQLMESFEKYETEIMGKGTHDKLHDLLRKFETKYLQGASK